MCNLPLKSLKLSTICSCCEKRHLQKYWNRNLHILQDILFYKPFYLCKYRLFFRKFSSAETLSQEESSCSLIVLSRISNVNVEEKRLRFPVRY